MFVSVFDRFMTVLESPVIFGSPGKKKRIGGYDTCIQGNQEERMQGSLRFE